MEFLDTPHNTEMINNIIQTVWNTNYVSDLVNYPIVLQEIDIGHTKNFLDNLENILDYYCLNIKPKDFIIIEKTQSAIFYDDSGSDLSDEEIEEEILQHNTNKIFLILNLIIINHYSP